MVALLAIQIELPLITVSNKEYWTLSKQDEPKNQSTPSELQPDTLLTVAGRRPHEYHGFVNPPVVRASTVLFPDVDALEERMGSRYPYGLTNTPTIEALTDAIDLLEESAGTVLVSSGLAAVTLPILAFASPGMRILIPDNVYYPTRRFGDNCLGHLGTEVVYYDPMIGGDIASLFGSSGTILFLESPGSQTFEVPDLQTMVAAARSAGVLTMIDNTWATPLLYKPIPAGIDISIQAGTKYFAGHSDLLIGSVSANEACWPRLKQFHRNTGQQAGTEEIWLTLRGMRTLSVRLDRLEKSALEIANWLAEQSAISRVLHPALPSCPGHEFWKRDFGRSTSLFAVELNCSQDDIRTFLGALQIFGLGFSWGGFESLAVPAELEGNRTANPWRGGPLVRLYIGLEDTNDLIADLDNALATIRET